MAKPHPKMGGLPFSCEACWAALPPHPGGLGSTGSRPRSLLLDVCQARALHGRQVISLTRSQGSELGCRQGRAWFPLKSGHTDQSNPGAWDLGKWGTLRVREPWRLCPARLRTGASVGGQDGHSLKGRGQPRDPHPLSGPTLGHLQARILPTVVSPQHLPQGWASS